MITSVASPPPCPDAHCNLTLSCTFALSHLNSSTGHTKNCKRKRGASGWRAGCRTGHKDLSLLCQISQVLKHVNAFYLFLTATLLDSISPEFLSSPIPFETELPGTVPPTATQNTWLSAFLSEPELCSLCLQLPCSSSASCAPHKPQATSSLSCSLLESLPILPRHYPHPT